jgi:hypothetical protein
MLELEGNIAKEWTSYTDILTSIFISLREDDKESIVWLMNEKNGIYTVNLGYITLVEAVFEGDREWWWSYVWKYHMLVKTKIMLWLAIENKMLTWDNGIKIGWTGPKRCSLCKVESEFVQHLFILYQFAQQVMSEVLKLLNVHGTSLLGNILELLKTWKVDLGTKDFSSLPFFMVYFLWWARNVCIFEDFHIPLKIVTSLVFKLSQEFRSVVKVPKHKVLSKPIIDKSMSWVFFDRASQGHPLGCGAKAIVYIIDSHYFKIHYSSRRETNIKVKISALWALLCLW